ncbi:uracil phosphoribosyltransferase, partial [Enterococcus faecalis]|uniref:uracil phosphoribosyltransferase n=1 Tax=Enterococcus faecalis TaxID=1351 RepID=UPI003D6A95EA
VDIGMSDGILELIRAGKVGHVGLYRDDETLQAHEYFVKLPEDIASRQFFVVDLILTAGRCAIVAIDSLKERGASN